ncbi:IclR family transcriptional regulator, partial [Achromobacter sp. KAs 3-5]
MNKPDSEGSGPRILRRGLKVLGVLRQAGAAGMHVVDIARAAGMQRSTVYRYLDVLVEEGYALRESGAPRWRVAELGVMMAGDPHAQAVRSLRPLLRQISDVSGDSAFLICRAANDSLCLHREVGNYPVQVLAVTVGHRQPLGVERG